MGGHDPILKWLQYRVTVDEAEAKAGGANGIPFGYINREWTELRAKLQPGCELWYFSSPSETWTEFPHSGMEGYAVLQNGVIIGYILTAIS